jgi:ribonuclease HI
MTYYHRVILYFDGASRHNPHGPAGCGWALYEMDRHGAVGGLVDEGSQYLGYNVSNNQAEYQGLEDGLDYVYENISCNGLYIRGDSEIVINQINGVYEVRSENVRPYYRAAMQSLRRCGCEYWSAKWVPRNENWRADNLANKAIDEY